MGLPNPYVLTELLIEYLISRKPEWEGLVSKSRSLVNDVKTKKTNQCIELNSNYYDENKKVANNLKEFDGWIEIIAKISKLARDEIKLNHDSALFDYLHAKRTYILDALSEKPCVVISSEMVPSENNLNQFPSPAYIFSKNKFFYLNTNYENKIIEITMSDVEKLMKEIEATDKPKLLTKEQLNKITSMTNHTHDKLTSYIDSLIEKKFLLEQKITDQEKIFALTVEENKLSQRDIENLKKTISELWNTHEQVVIELIDLGHTKTLAKAQLYGIFDNLEFPNEKDHSTKSRELGIDINYSIPLQYQPGYFKLHYKVWCQPNTEVDFETFQRNANKTDISIPQNRKPPAEYKKTKISAATGSLTGFASVTVGTLSNFVGAIANNFSPGSNTNTNSSLSTSTNTNGLSPLQRKFF